jgi:MFS family permease
MSGDRDDDSRSSVSGRVVEMKQERKQVQEMNDDRDDIIQVDNNDNNRAEEKVVALDDDQEKQQSSKPLDSGTGPAPDGGFVAWLQVGCGFLALFNSWGIVNAFGAYQQYYESNRLSDETSSTISWIGSIQGFMVVTATIVFGRLVDAGYTRQVLMAGTFLLSFGMMMTSLGDEFYQIFLAQGVCAGLGCSCMFVSAVANVASYFNKKRASALGIMASGSSLGGVIYPIMVRRLIPQVGFPWATRIIGFMIFGTCLIPTFFLFPRIKARKSGPLFDYASLRDLPFMLFSLGCFFGFIGLYVPIFYIESYAKHVGFSEDLTGYMVSILSAGSVFGRLVPNFIADRTGPLNILIPCTLCAGILCFIWIAIDNHAGTIVFAVLYGFFSGTYVSVPPACVSMMTKDMSMIGTRLGMNFFFTGLGVLIGTPVAGAIITRQGGSYLGAQIFAGVAVFLAAICICAARIAFIGRKLMVKA